MCSDSGDESDRESESGTSTTNRGVTNAVSPIRRQSLLSSSLSHQRRHHYGSFYLRMGAVGKCNLIYSTPLKKKINSSSINVSKFRIHPLSFDENLISSFLVQFTAFGIGSMIYSGLEFGQYFELERNTKCHNVLLALTPATRMAFIFIQMYFIFLNNEVRILFPSYV